ncbi:MAG: radical SAM protein [Elusimicrobia bacterium]|nr:radical SAM protein [Elusimicrobiota bacterium]
MRLIEPVIRPPSEAYSLILQPTLGCPDNTCTFCPAYKTKPFKIKSLKDIETDIKQAFKAYPQADKIFLADGDTLRVPFDDLVKILDLLNKHFKYLRRISLYATTQSILEKSVSELQTLKSKKMSLVYTGFETGCEATYKFIQKAGAAQDNVEAGLKLKEAGIKSNVTVILGLGGKALSQSHAIETAKILSAARPEQIAALTLMIPPEAPLYKLVKNGEFTPLTPFEIINELGLMVANMEDFKCLFFANHASNYVPIEARFPKDRQLVLNTLKEISLSKNKSTLKPDFLRGL